MIVKVQRPIYPTDAPCLISTEEHRSTWIVKLSEETIATMGDSMKAYFTAKEVGNEVVLLERVDDQDW